MKTGATVSGAMHMGLLILAIWGTDWFGPRDPIPLTVTEIELVDGTEFDAALSTAPFVPNEGPSDLAPPSEEQSAPSEVPQPEDSAQSAEAPVLTNTETPDQTPQKPVVQIPPPPTNVPTEPPVATIAEIPSPDPLDQKSTEPESPASTQPVQPLASAPSPQPAPRPMAPPEPEPEIEQTPDPEPVQAQAPDATAEVQPEPEPEPVQDPEPDSVAEAQPEAPEGLAPQEARLPIAKPADRAAAAEAARQQDEAQQIAENTAKPDAPAKPATPNKPDQPAKPAAQAGGSTAAKGPKLNRGEKDALRLGIKKYYTFNGDRSDKAMRVTIRIKLDKQGKIVGKPEQRSARGGSGGAQAALSRAGRSALIRAANAGEFKRLPVAKYQHWKVINFIFTIDGFEVSS